MGKHDMAIKDFTDAIALKPDMSQGYFRLGLSKYYLKRYEEAIQDF